LGERKGGGIGDRNKRVSEFIQLQLIIGGSKNIPAVSRRS
jgi:hypothetical protein